MDFPLPDDADIWGTPFDALPAHPVKRENLRPLLDHARVDAVRVPTEGGEIVDEHGPIVTGNDPRTVSEFLLIQPEARWNIRFGYPEALSGSIDVPNDLSRAMEEGYVRWWQNELQLDEDDPGGEEMWAFFEERTEELTW